MTNETPPGPYSEMPATADPRPSPEARALRAVGVNLDTLGELATEHAAKLQTLIELECDDGHKLDRLELGQKEVLAKLEQVLAFLRPLDSRVQLLEQWRGEHERVHTRQ